MSELNIPDEVGLGIVNQLGEANPNMEVGFMLLVVSHGEPLQSMSNLDEPQQLYLCGLAEKAIAHSILESASRKAAN